MTLTTPKKGRPSVDTEPVTVRLHTQTIGRIDAWRRQQDDIPTRPEAIRRLIEASLTRASAKK